MSKSQRNKITEISTKAIIVFTLASFFYFYDFLIQVSPSVMTTQLMHHFGITAAALGAMAGAFYYTYTAFQIPAGLLLGYFGARKILLCSIATCSLGTFLFAFAPNASIIGLARLITGGASAFAFLATLLLILRWLPLRHFAFFAGLTQMLGSFGAMGGTSFLAFLIKHLGWQHSILFFGIVGIILFILVFFFLQDSPEPGKIKNDKEIMFVELFNQLKSVLAKKQTWAIALYSFAIWAPIATFAALWGVPFLKTTYHLTPAMAANGIAIIWLGVALASPLIGWISEKINRRKSPLMLSALLGLLTMIAIIYFNNIPLWVLFICLFLMGTAASGQSLSFALITDNHHFKNTSTANGINNMSIVLGGALFQPLVGDLLDHHWRHPHSHSAPIYLAQNYHSALMVLPICYFIALLASSFLIRETFCKNINHSLEHPKT